MKCISCENFATKNKKHAALGLGRCKADWPMEILVPWNARPECSKRVPVLANLEELGNQREEVGNG